jgi:hypothetical protein
MTEDQARQVLWVLTCESAPAGSAPAGSAAWSADDRAWATREALALVGERATPEAFVTTRASLALGRLLPRDAAGQRFLARRLWHPAWVLAAMALGLVTGLLVDQLGVPLRVNLLAPAVWAVVGWNLVVYALMLWPRRNAWPAPLLRGLERSAEGALLAWWRHAAPLTGQRLLLLMHAAAAALALGLIAGLYLRGLVLDYRAGWQSTFLSPPEVQSLLNVLLAPASALTGVPVAHVGPLQLPPGAEAQASAAPWIHLYAATLGLFVVLPRLVLAAWAAGRSQRLSRHFPLPLDLPGLRSLHPLMRPGPPRPLRLLWAAPSGLATARLLEADVAGPTAPLRLWQTEDDDAVELLPLPAPLSLDAAVAPPRGTWQRLAAWWRGPDVASTALQALRGHVDLVLLVTGGAAVPPTWLADLGRPVLHLVDAPQATAPALPLRHLADGWLPGGALLQALRAALPDDDRLARINTAWRAHQAQRLTDTMGLLSQSLGRLAVMRAPVADEGLLARKDDGSAARQALTQQLTAELQGSVQQLAHRLGLQAGTLQAHAVQVEPTVKGRVGEGRAAVLGGVLSGALAGLKADLLTGGFTMGAGAVAGGVIGALGAAGAARGVNAARGTEVSHAAWGDDSLQALALGLLLPYLQLAHGLQADAARARLRPAVAAQLPALRAAWQQRHDAAAVAQAAAPVLERCVRQALGGPA